jgi:hypothetical protein
VGERDASRGSERGHRDPAEQLATWRIKELAFCPLTNRGAAIGLVMAWSPQREGPVLKTFLNLVRAYRNWPLAQSSPRQIRLATALAGRHQ